MEPVTILVCDRDEEFLSSLKSAQVPHVAFRTSSSYVESQHLLVDKRNRFSSICLNLNVCNPNLFNALRFTKSQRPMLPISLLSDTAEIAYSAEELNNLHIQKVLNKPISAQKLVAETISVDLFDMEKTLALSQKESASEGEEKLLEDDELHPIEAESFLCGSKSFFDVYVRIREKKFILILKAQNSFDPERVATYLRKGVKHFYIRKEAQLFFLQYCDKLANAIVEKDSIPAEVKQKAVMNLGEETAKYLSSTGISEVSIRAAHQFVEQSQRLLRKLDLSAAPELPTLLKTLQESDHSAGLTLMLGMLCNELGYKDKNVVNVIGLSGFLHDIGLLLLPENLRNADYEKLVGEEKAKFEQHPILGAEKLTSIRNLNPLVLQVTKQHHERRSKKGYPLGLGSGQISPISELVGIADIFHELVTKQIGKTGLCPKDEMESHHFKDFSLQTVEGFRKVFGK